MHPTTSGSTGYTAVVHYSAPTGDTWARDAAAQDLLQTAADHAGHRGSVVLRGGSPAAPELYIVLSFDSQESWQHWESSDPARRAIARLDQVTGAPGDGHLVDSMAGWFNLPELSGLRTPPRWKSAVVSFVALTPLIFGIQTLLQPVIAGLNGFLAGVTVSLIVIPLATYLVMPVMTRVLRHWLYPEINTGLTESFPDSERYGSTTGAT
jgi:uncharacterized protein